MKQLKKVFLLLIICLGTYGFILYKKDLNDVPVLQDGDIIFQSNYDSQSLAVTLASASVYTHTGIIKKNPDGYGVIEAFDVVRETPLSHWVERGILQRLAIYRHKNLTNDQGKKIVQSAESFRGLPYDIFFFEDDRQIYCSELPYKAFKTAGISIGKWQTIGSLYINNSAVKSLIERRWKKYPGCIGRDYNFEQCYDVIMSNKLITPVSIADDNQFELIFTNYRL